LQLRDFGLACRFTRSTLGVAPPALGKYLLVQYPRLDAPRADGICTNGIRQSEQFLLPARLLWQGLRR
jgi:hypothetical protein